MLVSQETYAMTIFVKKITFGRFLLSLALHVGGPEGEVVSQQLESKIFKPDWTIGVGQKVLPVRQI